MVWLSFVFSNLFSGVCFFCFIWRFFFFVLLLPRVDCALCGNAVYSLNFQFLS